MNDSQATAAPDLTNMRLALEIAKSLQTNRARQDLLKQILPDVLHTVGSESGGLVAQNSGSWDIDCWVGESDTVPEAALSDVIDKSNAIIHDQWCIAPLSIDTARGDVTPAAFVAHIGNDGSNGRSGELVAEAVRAAELIALVLNRFDSQNHNQRRIEQLAAVLNAAAQWQRLDDNDALLHAIADTATDLLNCERASIFLWDKRRKKLIGRPALGIDGDSLEVDDDAGVVGEVLRSGDSQIWNSKATMNSGSTVALIDHFRLKRSH